MSEISALIKETLAPLSFLPCEETVKRRSVIYELGNRPSLSIKSATTLTSQSSIVYKLPSLEYFVMIA